MSTQFSVDCKYFAQITIDGKIKIWDTASNALKQEFTPNLHLTTPCTCLHWIHSKSQTPWKKRKRRQSESSVTQENTYTHYLAFGTSSGTLLLYSLATMQVETTVDSATSYPICCLSWEQTNGVYAGADQFVIQFDLKDRCVKSKWKTGNDKISSILIIPKKTQLLTASRTIKLWDIKSQEVIKTFTGHSSDVSTLNYIHYPNSDPYFISSSKSDRILSCWSLLENSTEKNAIASLLMEDIALSVCILGASSNVANITAVTRSGVAHIYQHTLNGKCGKPIKPKVTIQVASDTGQSKDLVTPIPVVAAHIHEDTSLLLAYGNHLLLTFENVIPSSYERVQCLIRKDPVKVLTIKENDISKTKQPIVDKNVQYLTPHTTAGPVKRKSGKDAGNEVTMEKRLENLTLNKLDTAVPRVDNLAQLLVQGLHSKDKTILRNVLSKRDENTIRNTIKRLSMQVIVPLLTELTCLIQGKTSVSQIGLLWLRHLIQIHASQLIANPHLIDLIGPILGTIESRLSLLSPVSRLRGRLDLLITQISNSSKEENEVEDALLTFKDGGSSDSEDDENLEILHSDSEIEWAEEDSNDSNQSDSDVKENNVSDHEMSM